ncbi:MAG: Uma2 family endonuclease, partial [Saprospiraceae bacterium]
LCTIEEYFEMEETAAFKSEFRNGKILPMAAGTISHNRLKITISSLLFMLALQMKNFEAFDSDQKIYLPEYAHSVYADASVVVGEPKMYKDGNHAILNPTLVIEVLSNSTSNYDRSAKFRKYQTLESFQEYVLIDQEMPVIDVLTKQGERDWRMKTCIGLEDEVNFESINVTLKMADIYQKVKDLKDPQAALEFNPEEE